MQKADFIFSKWLIYVSFYQSNIYFSHAVINNHSLKLSMCFVGVCVNYDGLVTDVI